MSGNVKPIPEGYHNVTPYLIVNGAAQAIDFYKQVFGASEVFRFPRPDGRIAHAEIKIGDSIVMLADEDPKAGAQSPQTLGGTAMGLMIYLPDVDQVFQRALTAGAKVRQPVDNKFYGDRSGAVIDPFGHQWTIATHVEDVSPQEMEKRMAAMRHVA